MTFITWLVCLLVLAGDVHPNPGPSSTHSVSSTCSSTSTISQSLSDLMSGTGCLSVLHYNVQSLFNKVDVLEAEFSSFDVLSFSETWLSSSDLSDDIRFRGFHAPERRDRKGDSHGGVIVYVKDSLHYIRRPDLEPTDLECIWVEVSFTHSKRVLIGTFYRPPNSNAIYTSLIEDSLSLVLDTNISDIVVTGDFNFNLSNPNSYRKLTSICQYFNLNQLISEPTHFTETSSSILDLFLVSCSHRVIASGVGEPVLDQNVRFHCPIFALFAFSKPKLKSFKRLVWQYDRGDYDSLRRNICNTNWEILKDDNIEAYAASVTQTLLDLSKQCIPTKFITVKSNDSPWITTQIKQKIRKRKKLYRKAKHSQQPLHWRKFRQIRNEIVSLIRSAKQDHFNKISDSLKSDTNSQTNWWKLIKGLLSPNEKQTIPALKHEQTNELVFDPQSKSNLLNEFFCGQSSLDIANKELPHNYYKEPTNKLLTISISPQDVEDALITLKTNKATGPDDINNRILKETASAIKYPLCSLFNHSLQRSLDDGLEIRTVFFDISKAFDKVWHDGLLLKLRKAGVDGPLLSWFSNYLTNRRQSVILPGAKSNWCSLQAGVPQGSILGPLLFLVYINDIVEDIGARINMFADDTSLHIVVDHPVLSAQVLQTDINKISTWADTWLVKFNPSKSETMLISRKANKPLHPPLLMNNQQISTVTSHKHLGVYLSEDGSWHNHITHITERAWKRIYLMRKLKFQLDRKSLEIIYFSFIRPILEYADVVYCNCTQYEKQELDKIQNEASRIVSGTTQLISFHNLHKEVPWESLETRRLHHKLILLYKMKNGLTPEYLSSLVPQTVGETATYNLRNAADIQELRTRTALYYNSFLPSALREWNDLSPQLQNSPSLSSFKHRIRVRFEPIVGRGK
ncbi:uncharacterized protein LOC128548935 [Mercenaria mercenaria]|uniref:uncharacterized protein LOC128548935 n=1 Tax=Mercenaria mercenaria TaxID=6596 RepID=UPI00234F00AA|nr:uncharacterized protein LOC128548935 [Mercenaria mercenaria]